MSAPSSSTSRSSFWKEKARDVTYIARYCSQSRGTTAETLWWQILQVVTWHGYQKRLKLTQASTTASWYSVVEMTGSVSVLAPSIGPLDTARSGQLSPRTIGVGGCKSCACGLISGIATPCQTTSKQLTRADLRGNAVIAMAQAGSVCKLYEPL